MLSRFSLALSLLLVLLPTTALLSGCDDAPGEEETEVEVSVDRDREGGGDGDEEEAAEEEAEAEAIEKERKEGRYRLRIDPKVGTRYSYEVARDETMTAGDITTKRSQTFNVDMEVVRSNDDGSSVLGITYSRVRAEISMPGAVIDSAGRPLLDSAGQLILRNQVVRFDTKGKSDIQGGERYRAFVGRQALVTIDSKGNVIDVANVDPILNATLKHLKVSADTVNPKMLEVAKQSIRLEYGTLVSLVFFNLAPDTAVGAGSTWSRSDTLPVGGLPSRTTYAYSLKEISEKDDHPVARIAGRLTTNPKLPKESVENEMVSMKITGLSVDGNSTLSIDLVDGFPLSRSSTITSTLKGTGTMKAGPEKGKTAPITMKESTRTSIRQTARRTAQG